VFLEGCSVKIGGPNKTVEIDESKFGKRKYHRGHPFKGQWVFGGVERDREYISCSRQGSNHDTLMAVIRDWIKPGTTVISDCWGAYRGLGSQGYTHLTVNHSIQFMDPTTGAHTNTTESTWRKVKAFLGQYNRGGLWTSFGPLRVRGEVQGAGRVTFRGIPATCREHRFVTVSTSLNCPRHVIHTSVAPHTGMYILYCVHLEVTDVRYFLTECTTQLGIVWKSVGLGFMLFSSNRMYHDYLRSCKLFRLVIYISVSVITPSNLISYQCLFKKMVKMCPDSRLSSRLYHSLFMSNHTLLWMDFDDLFKSQKYFQVQCHNECDFIPRTVS
jgi:hypothetical protein